MPLLPSRKAAKVLGVHPTTLRRWADDGGIRHVKTRAGQRLYDVESFVGAKTGQRSICYARVSSRKQADDLERQVAHLKRRFPGHEVVTDIGSGLNFRRKGLRALLESAMRGDVKEIVVAHRDRLSRFGFELIQWLVESNGGKLVVLDNTALSPEAELTADLLAILHVFSCRMHGLRAYSRQIKEDQTLPH